MGKRIQQRRDTEENWTAANPVLADGEFGWERDFNRLKIGDGVTHWLDLPYVNSSMTQSSDEPLDPEPGDLWLDGNLIMYIWSGMAWIQIP